MNITEWNETWQRIKDRFPNWQPTATESEDWCMGLKVYPEKMVEAVGHWVSTTYSSKEPKLAWYIRECEKRKSEEIQSNEPEYEEVWKLHKLEYELQREAMLRNLEESSLDDLREACIKVLEKSGHLISKPTSGNPREWKPTLQSLVHIELNAKKE